MNNKLYVGNLNFAVTQQDLSDFFLGHGSVLETVVVTDRSTGNSRGFGFVTMASENDALTAIEELNGKELLGSEVAIKLALDRERGGGGGGGRGGYRGGGGGGDRRGGGGRRGGRNWDR
jgi:cold-inducible RNA-binding protein